MRDSEIIFFGRMVSRFHTVGNEANGEIVTFYYDDILRGIKISEAEFGDVTDQREKDMRFPVSGEMILHKVCSGTISSHTAIKYLEMTVSGEKHVIGNEKKKATILSFSEGLRVKLFGISYNPDGKYICALAFKIVKGY